MAANLGHFISDINIWFDIFNSYVPKGSVPSKSTYGIDLENQNEHLKNVHDLISTMRVNGKKSLLTFQDSLENFFMQIRSRGGPDEHPTPLGAIYRIRMILLGKNPGILNSKVNTEEKVIEEYICTKVLETAKITIAIEEIHDDVNELQSSSSFSSVSSCASCVHLKIALILKKMLRKLQMTLWSILQDTLPKNTRLVYQIWVTTLTK
jgi:hypothetical protein